MKLEVNPRAGHEIFLIYTRVKPEQTLWLHGVEAKPVRDKPQIQTLT